MTAVLRSSLGSDRLRNSGKVVEQMQAFKHLCVGVRLNPAIHCCHNNSLSPRSSSWLQYNSIVTLCHHLLCCDLLKDTMATAQSSLSQQHVSRSFLLSQSVMTLMTAAVMWQVLVLNVEGRVLTPDQMRAGLYILPSEAALATSLLQGGAWAPPHISQQSVANEPAGELTIPLLECAFNAEHVLLTSPCEIVLTTVLVKQTSFSIDAQALQSVARRLLCMVLQFHILHHNSLK